MATLGLTTADATNDSWGSGEMPLCGPWTATEAGTITEIRVYAAESGTTTIKGVVYTGSAVIPVTRLCYSNDTTVAGGGSYINCAPVNGTVTFASGDNLWIGFLCIGGTPGTYHASGTHHEIRDSGLGTGAPPATYGTESGHTDDLDDGFYITYTPGAAAVTGQLVTPFTFAVVTAGTVITAGPVNTVAPEVTGTPTQGQTLTCGPGTWTT